MPSPDLSSLWTRIEKRLDAELCGWRGRIVQLGQVEAIKKRARRDVWMDGEVFEALLRAVLSGGTEWSKLERVEDELKDLFCDFDFSRYAQVSPGEVRARSVPWFQARSAGSQNLAGSLIHLAETARILSDWATEHKSTDSYFTTIVNSV